MPCGSRSCASSSFGASLLFLVLYGATIAEQASVLTATVKSQIATVKDFLDRHGVDTSFLDLGALTAADNATSTSPHLPNAGALASGTSTVLNQTLKILRRNSQHGRQHFYRGAARRPGCGAAASLP